MTIERTPSFKSLQKAYRFKFQTSSRSNPTNTTFDENPFHPILHNHPLTGSLQGFRSFSITGDFRIKCTKS